MRLTMWSLSCIMLGDTATRPESVLVYGGTVFVLRVSMCLLMLAKVGIQCACGLWIMSDHLSSQITSTAILQLLSCQVELPTSSFLENNSLLCLQTVCADLSVMYGILCWHCLLARLRNLPIICLVTLAAICCWKALAVLQLQPGTCQ